MKKLLIVFALFLTGCPQPVKRTQAPPNPTFERFEVIGEQVINNSSRSFSVVVMKDKETKRECIVFVTYNGTVTVVKNE